MGDATDDVLPTELRPDTRPFSVDGCGVCKPPEDTGQNHRPLPNLPPLTKFAKTGY